MHVSSAYMWVLVYGEYTLCICGVKVLPMVNFRPIDSDVLNVISRIVGIVQGDITTPWFRSM
jgi:hypothetical protein